MVDYDFDESSVRGTVSNFRCYLADWGTSGVYKGGTPMYAGPRTYEKRIYRRNSKYRLYVTKDFFSLGRLALELFMQREGNMNTL